MMQAPYGGRGTWLIYPIVDSDTQVPADCLLDAVSEMEQSPDVGIMQFASGVMQVVHTYFENGITFFTNLIYSAIKYTVSNGDVAPFVGHNAILRWAAIQQVSYMDEDGYEKFWSESHVSEDFDMSLRLQCNGFIIRLAAWAGEGFKEGVSLTVYDELARWEKYAYGCNELLFYPIRMWLWKGPFTPLFRKFLFSNIRFTSKITIISYIGTYYAIGAAWIMTTANYLAIGWFNGYLDKYYIDSWKVWFSIVIVFNGLGNLALAAMRYRDDKGGFFENSKPTAVLGVSKRRKGVADRVQCSPAQFQMDVHAGRLPRRAVAARVVGPARSHVRDRHDVGGDGEGSRVFEFLHRGAESAEEVQMEHVVLARGHRRHDRFGDGGFRATGLAGEGFRGDFAHGDGGVESHAAPDRVEPGLDDVFMVEEGGEEEVDLRSFFERLSWNVYSTSLVWFGSAKWRILDRRVMDEWVGDGWVGEFMSILATHLHNYTNTTNKQTTKPPLQGLGNILSIFFWYI